MKAPYFPVGTEEWMANIAYIDPKEKKLQYGPMQITYYSAHHPGITYGYNIKTKNKTIIYIPDNECLSLDKSIEENTEDLTEEETTMFRQMNQEEYEAEMKTIINADILIHDAQYTPEDYKKKRGWGHSCYIDIINMAIDANVKNLYLFSHDPNNDDEIIDGIHKECLKIIENKKSSLKCFVARETLEINLD